jgi:hypothetical protein
MMPLNYFEQFGSGPMTPTPSTLALKNAQIERGQGGKMRYQLGYASAAAIRPIPRPARRGAALGIE